MGTLERLAMLGCCGETLVNFRMLKLPAELNVNLADANFWICAVFIVAEAFLKPMVGLQEKKTHIVTHYLGPIWGFLSYACLLYVISFWGFVFFCKVILLQPRVALPDQDYLTPTGYLLSLAGLFVKILTYFTTPAPSVLGGYYFGIQSTKNVGDLPMTDDPYYHPLGTATFMCYAGFSLARGSLAGFLLAVTAATSYYSAFQFERVHLKKLFPATDKKQSE